MITPYDVYCAYNNARNKRTFSEEKYRNRLSDKNLLQIDKTAMYFNTVYSNIDLDMYMQCGFKLWKTFNPSRFLDERIIEEYKNQDKKFKRTIKVTKEDIDSSFEYIGMPLDEYCHLISSSYKNHLIISGYIKNRIHSVIIVYCLYNRLIRFDDLQRDYVYNILNNYDEWVSLMYKWEDYIKQKNEEYRNEENRQTVS
jgi:hypothetical protein